MLSLRCPEPGALLEVPLSVSGATIYLFKTETFLPSFTHRPSTSKSCLSYLTLSNFLHHYCYYIKFGFLSFLSSSSPSFLLHLGDSYSYSRIQLTKVPRESSMSPQICIKCPSYALSWYPMHPPVALMIL